VISLEVGQIQGMEHDEKGHMGLSIAPCRPPTRPTTTPSSFPAGSPIRTSCA
jgi:hypothetical protein